MNVSAATRLTIAAGPGRPATNRRTAAPTRPMKKSVPTWTTSHRPGSSRRLPYMSPGSGAGWNISSAAQASGPAAHQARISTPTSRSRGPGPSCRRRAAPCGRGTRHLASCAITRPLTTATTSRRISPYPSAITPTNWKAVVTAGTLDLRNCGGISIVVAVRPDPFAEDGLGGPVAGGRRLAEQQRVDHQEDQGPARSAPATTSRSSRSSRSRRRAPAGSRNASRRSSGWRAASSLSPSRPNDLGDPPLTRLLTHDNLRVVVMRSSSGGAV